MKMAVNSAQRTKPHLCSVQFLFAGDLVSLHTYTHIRSFTHAPFYVNAFPNLLCTHSATGDPQRRRPTRELPLQPRPVGGQSLRGGQKRRGFACRGASGGLALRRRNVPLCHEGSGAGSAVLPVGRPPVNSKEHRSDVLPLLWCELAKQSAQQKVAHRTWREKENSTFEPFWRANMGIGVSWHWHSGSSRIRNSSTVNL